MERWYWICALLCLVGIFKEFRPSEPYVTKYIVQYKNVTRDELTHVLYPIATYSYLGTLPLIFLVTDFLRYKTVVVFECLALVGCYTLLIWGEGFNNLKILEVLYGFASSAEVAYFTYIYAKVKRENFKKVTSYVHTAIIIGNLVAALSAQAFISLNLLDIRQLNFLTLSSCIGALILAFFLPSVKKSIYFHQNLPLDVSKSLLRNNNPEETVHSSATLVTSITPVRNPCQVLWKDFKLAYSNSHVLKWSVWWAMAAAGNYMIRTYVQALWEDYAGGNDRNTSIYNGAVDAVHTFFSTILALSVGYLKIPWSKYGESLLSGICFLQAGLLFWMALVNSLVVAYINYIILRVTFQVMITIASAEVALQISPDSYGLIFGINRFLALIIQTILTLVINDENGLALSERNQFLAYGCYHLGIGICYALAFIVLCARSRSSSDSTLTSTFQPNQSIIENRISDQTLGQRSTLTSP